MKSVIWFAVQMKIMVSIWHATLGWNGFDYNLISKMPCEKNLKHSLRKMVFQSSEFTQRRNFLQLELHHHRSDIKNGYEAMFPLSSCFYQIIWCEKIISINLITFHLLRMFRNVQFMCNLLQITCFTSKCRIRKRDVHMMNF